MAQMGTLRGGVICGLGTDFAVHLGTCFSVNYMINIETFWWNSWGWLDQFWDTSTSSVMQGEGQALQHLGAMLERKSAYVPYGLPFCVTAMGWTPPSLWEKKNEALEKKCGHKCPKVEISGVLFEKKAKI